MKKVTKSDIIDLTGGETLTGQSASRGSMAHNHKFSRRSIGYLNGCEPVLKEYAICMLKHAPFDLSILKSTIRTFAEQQEFYRLGTTRTMESMHLPGRNGVSRAIDVAPYIAGVNVWKLPTSFFEEMHEAGQAAAREMNLNVRSGITWDNLNSPVSVDDQLWNYRQRKRNAGEKPFFDGPHFELYKREYP